MSFDKKIDLPAGVFNINKLNTAKDLGVTRASDSPVLQTKKKAQTKGTPPAFSASSMTPDDRWYWIWHRMSRLITPAANSRAPGGRAELLQSQGVPWNGDTHVGCSCESSCRLPRPASRAFCCQSLNVLSTVVSIPRDISLRYDLQAVRIQQKLLIAPLFAALWASS